MSIVLDALKKAAGSEGKKASSEEDGGSSYLQSSQSPSVRWSLWLATGGTVVLVLFLWLYPFPKDAHSPGKIPELTTQPFVASTTARSEPSADSFSPLTEGLSFFHRGDYAKAMLKFQEAVQKRPDSAIAYNNLGLALKKLGRSEDASQAYQKALTLNPSYVEAMNNLAVLSILDNRMDQASELFISALRHRPQYPEVHLNYAVLLEQTGNHGGAVEHYRAYLRFASPEDPMVGRIRDHLRQFQ